MRVLIVKTSSMGDVIHTLPAITDAMAARSDITFDWLVEEKFAELASWHPAVQKIIPIKWREWRKHLLTPSTYVQWRAFRKDLNQHPYDMIIDAQGLLKSAFFASLAIGPRYGFAADSAREKWAAKFYHHGFSVSRNQHAIERLRYLFSQILKYPLPASIANYGLNKSVLLDAQLPKPYVVFLHGTTWETKHWPEHYWLALGQLVDQHGFAIKLPWGSTAELARAERIGAYVKSADILPKMGLRDLAKTLAQAQGVVALDTGLGHLAAALDVPTVSIYGPTNPGLTGAMGVGQVHLKATFPCAPCLNRLCTFKGNALTHPAIQPPCFSTITPEMVWSTLAKLMPQPAPVTTV